MLVEELQAVAIKFDGAPGMGINQAGEIGFKIGIGELFRAAIEEDGELYGSPIAPTGFVRNQGRSD